MKHRLGLSEVRIDPDAVSLLRRYNWPGNVRELENIISRAVLKVSRERARDGLLQIRPEHLAGDLGSAFYVRPAPVDQASGGPPGKISLREAVKSFQIRLIEKALERNDGNWAAAARDLGMDRSNLHNLSFRLGMRNKG